MSQEILLAPFLIGLFTTANLSSDLASVFNGDFIAIKVAERCHTNSDHIWVSGNLVKIHRLVWNRNKIATQIVRQITFDTVALKR